VTHLGGKPAWVLLAGAFLLAVGAHHFGICARRIMLAGKPTNKKGLGTDRPYVQAHWFCLIGGSLPAVH
jgi:hypothetical protein